FLKAEQSQRRSPRRSEPNDERAMRKCKMHLTKCILHGAAGTAKKDSSSGDLVVVLAEEGLHEIDGDELAEILRALAEADVLDGDRELVADGEDDAALRRAVELREDDAGQLEGVLEHGRLRERVLARRRIEDEQRLV